MAELFREMQGTKRKSSATSNISASDAKRVFPYSSQESTSRSLRSPSSPNNVQTSPTQLLPKSLPQIKFNPLKGTNGQRPPHHVPTVQPSPPKANRVGWPVGRVRAEATRRKISNADTKTFAELIANLDALDVAQEAESAGAQPGSRIKSISPISIPTIPQPPPNFKPTYKVPSPSPTTATPVSTPTTPKTSSIAVAKFDNGNPVPKPMSDQALLDLAKRGAFSIDRQAQEFEELRHEAEDRDIDLRYRPRRMGKWIKKDRNMLLENLAIQDTADLLTYGIPRVTLGQRVYQASDDAEVRFSLFWEIYLREEDEKYAMGKYSVWWHGIPVPYNAKGSTRNMVNNDPKKRTLRI